MFLLHQPQLFSHQISHNTQSRKAGYTALGYLGRPETDQQTPIGELCVHVCTFVCMCTVAYMYTHGYASVCMHMYDMHVCVYVHEHMYACVYMFCCIHAYMYVHINTLYAVFEPLYMCVCMYV